MLDPISLGQDRSRLVKMLKGTCSALAHKVPALCKSAEIPLNAILIEAGIRFFLLCYLDEKQLQSVQHEWMRKQTESSTDRLLPLCHRCRTDSWESTQAANRCLSVSVLTERK